MTLSLYQFSFNGLTFGAGTQYAVTNVDGLGGVAPLRVQDDNRGYADGSFSGRDFYDGRTITFDITTYGNGTNSAHYYYQLLQSSLTPQTYGYPSALQALTFQLSSDMTSNKVIYGRVRINNTLIDADYTYGYIRSQISFYCPDPRYYDASYQNAVSTSVAVTNSGWATTCPKIFIASPTSSFVISNNITGDSMTFAGVNTGYDITIDLLNKVITQNSTAIPARSKMTAFTNWICVAGNSTNTISATNSNSMLVIWSNAFI